MVDEIVETPISPTHYFHVCSCYFDEYSNIFALLVGAPSEVFLKAPMGIGQEDLSLQVQFGEGAGPVFHQYT